MSQESVLPASLSLGPVRLQVADLDRSLAFYTTVLGLRVAEQHPGSATLAAQDEPLVILQERAGARPVRRRGHLGLFHFAILLPDRGALGAFLAHLAPLDVQLGASDHLVSEALYLHDPDGLGIEVYADRPQEHWQRAHEELLMDTRPLDMEGVMAEAEGIPWRGMPPGTRMGHMHLHVGDLGAAAGFYRDALGFKTTVTGYPGALFLAAGTYHHHLGVNTWAGRDAARPTEADAQLLEWELRMPGEDADAAASRLRAAGAVVESIAGGIRTTDPWGTALVVRA